MAKRARDNSEAETPTATPKKLRFDDAALTPTKSQQNTSSKRRPKIRAVSDSTLVGEQSSQLEQTTPKKQKGKGKATYTTPTQRTPTKKAALYDDGDTIRVDPNADRSARKKANRNLIQRTVEGNVSEDEQEDILARQIWDEDEAQDEESETDPDEVDLAQDSRDRTSVPDTPSKRGRGRPKGSKNRRTPTPPPNLPAHEQYFFQNRPNASKTSSNTVSSLQLLSHASYHEAMLAYKDPHEPSIEGLHKIHTASFPLWAFELSRGFNICLYGYGSKRRILTSFADYLHSRQTTPKPPLTIIINGHHSSLSIRPILVTILRAISPSSTTMPSTPALLLAAILVQQSSKSDPPPIYLLISAITARSLTGGTSPSIISALASYPSIHLVFTASNPSFPLLWPSPVRDALNLLFHDATTFLPYDDVSSSAADELGTGVVDSVAELMGKKGPAAAGRERVRWVLKSLPENARGLYRILVSEILAAEADGLGDTARLDEEDDDDMGDARRKKTGPETAELPGVDSKMLYQKAAEEFLCSSEMAFRGLLREFIDHAMVVIRRDGGGTGGGEILSVEMGREELEGVLEDLLA